MVTAFFLALSAVVMIWITQSWQGYVAAALFGMGIGGMLTVLPLAWADYFGRASYGAIRGTALAVQVVAQAAGPLISGILRDYTGDYVWSLWVFVVFSVIAILTAVLIRVPPPPAR
jgi:MFS family permease